MKTSRVFMLLALLVIAAALAWYFTSRAPSVGQSITVYYTKDDGTTEVPWTVTLRAAKPDESPSDRLDEAAFYAASQAVAGPPQNISAIRFPAGTHVLSATVAGSTARIDLAGEVKNQTGGSLTESAQFKSLVWTLTALPAITEVDVRVAGQKIATLPGGNLELDEPLRRSDW